MLKPIYHFLSSLKLTVFLLAASIVLVFFGTLDQVHWGIYKALAQTLIRKARKLYAGDSNGLDIDEMVYALFHV